MNEVFENESGWFNLEDYYEPKLQWRLKVDLGRVDKLLAIKDIDVFPIHGVVHKIKTASGKHMVGYFSPHRRLDVDAPDYEKYLSVFFDDFVFDDVAQPRFRFFKKIMSRRFEVLLDGELILSFEYSWPFYRELVSSTVTYPLYFKSKDFLCEFFDFIKFARPHWILS